MPTHLRLTSEQSKRALAILQHKLQELRPSRRQDRVYRLLNLDVWVFVISYILCFSYLFLTYWRFGEAPSFNDPIFIGLLVLAGGTGILLIPLFILNWGLIVKLWRIANVRRRLNLNEPLRAAFNTQRRKRRFPNFATGLLVCVGALYIVLPWVLSEQLQSDLAMSVPTVFFGLSLASFHFIRRGKERLAIVENLHSDLNAAHSDSDKDQESAINVSAANYDLIARIERDQIIQERLQSIKRSEENPRAYGYSVQTSSTAQGTKSNLPIKERNLVDAQILKLMEDPRLDEVIFDTQSNLRRLSVPNTSVEIDFDLDDEARRIRIIRIVSSSSEQINEPNGKS